MSSAPQEPQGIEILGKQLRAALPPLRLHSMSLYNADADVLWLSEGALGPDEHHVMVEGMDHLRAQKQLGYYELGLEDGRFAMFLPVRAPRGDLVGLVMMLGDHKALADALGEQMMTPRVRTALQKIAVFLRVGNSSLTDTGPSQTLPLAAIPPSCERAPAPIQVRSADDSLDAFEATVPSVEVAAATLNAAAVESILTLELASEARAPTEPSTSISEADLLLYIQELMRLRSQGRTRRFEILPRSRHDPARHAVPAAFTADSANGPAGSQLDASVVQMLLSWLGRHPDVLESHPASFSVNLSLGAIEDANFLSRIGQAIERAGVDASVLGFEIRESTCVRLGARVREFLAHCEKLGCFVVIDDFSFDSAAVPLLASPAVRTVKIEPRLISTARQEKLSQAILTAILQACKVLGVHCVAKRLENPADFAWLGVMGCDLAQGFALARPLSIESLREPAEQPPRVAVAGRRK